MRRRRWQHGRPRRHVPERADPGRRRRRRGRRGRGRRRRCGGQRGARPRREVRRGDVRRRTGLGGGRRRGRELVARGGGPRRGCVRDALSGGREGRIRVCARPRTANTDVSLPLGRRRRRRAPKRRRTALPAREQDALAIDALERDLALDPPPWPRRPNVQRVSRYVLVSEARRRTHGRGGGGGAGPGRCDGSGAARGTGRGAGGGDGATCVERGGCERGYVSVGQVKKRRGGAPMAGSRPTPARLLHVSGVSSGRE